MKTFKEILEEVFEPFTIIVLLSIFFGGLVVFTFLVGDTFLVALKDSFIITFATAVFVIFGRYIKGFEKE